MVFMTENVSNPGDLIPGNIRETRLCVAVNSTASLRDDLQAPFNRALR